MFGYVSEQSITQINQQFGLPMFGNVLEQIIPAKQARFWPVNCIQVIKLQGFDQQLGLV